MTNEKLKLLNEKLNEIKRIESANNLLSSLNARRKNIKKISISVEDHVDKEPPIEICPHLLGSALAELLLNYEAYLTKLKKEFEKM